MIPAHNSLPREPEFEFAVQLDEGVLCEGQVGRSEAGVLGLDGVFYYDIQPSVFRVLVNLPYQHSPDLVLQIGASVGIATVVGVLGHKDSHQAVDVLLPGRNPPSGLLQRHGD